MIPVESFLWDSFYPFYFQFIQLLKSADQLANFALLICCANEVQMEEIEV
jgi:hypothetical protein